MCVEMTTYSEIDIISNQGENHKTKDLFAVLVLDAKIKQSKRKLSYVIPNLT